MHFEATFNGLECWTKHMFEKLGWIVLAKNHGHIYKVTSYKKSLGMLKRSLEEKIKATQEQDRVSDLKILHRNVTILIGHVERTL